MYAASILILHLTWAVATIAANGAGHNGPVASGAGPNGLQCQPIAVSACQGLGYNMTALPNLAGHTNQLEAELQVSGATAVSQKAGTSRTLAIPRS